MKRYIVKVPVTVKACVEVEAKDAKAAIVAANEAVHEIEELYDGVGARLDRPTILGIEGGWFETEGQCEIFLGSGATVERTSERPSGKG